MALKLFIEVPPIGISVADGFLYDGTRPARHCGICGASYQPEEARSPNYHQLLEVRLQVDYLLKQWAYYHNSRHSEKEHQQYRDRANLMTPEAAIKLIPLGIYPIQDLVMDEEVQQAGLEARRCPNDDVPSH